MQISSQRLSSAAVPPAATPTRAMGAGPVQGAPGGPNGSGAPTPGAQGSGTVDAREAPPARPAGDDRASGMARLDGFADAMMQRLTMAAKSAPEGEAQSFSDAADSLSSGLARLRAGLENGTLTSSDIGKGVENAFMGAREILEAGRKPTVAAQSSVSADVAGRAEAEDNGAIVQGRFDGLTQSVMARIEGLDLSDRQSRAMVDQTAQAFESATARLDAALFNPETGDPVDRGTFQSLYASALESLQTQLTDMLGSAGSDGAVIYDARRGAEGLSALSSSLDVAG